MKGSANNSTAKNLEAKNIVLLFDGTGNQPGKHNTNVVKAASVIKNESPYKQIVFYDPGVGTFNKIVTISQPIKDLIWRWFGKAFGYGLKKNIADGYQFLMQHYNQNDHIYILGFSRGAFTARKFADLIAKYGLLPKGDENLLPNLLKDYLSKKEPTSFWKNMCIKSTPYFIGVWDTVGSLGRRIEKQFFDNKLHKDIPYACHAVAIDEKRKHFLPWRWDTKNLGEQQIINEVFFPGVHSDIGGWYREDGLSDISLNWMLKNAKNLGLQLCDNWDGDIKPDYNGIMHHSKTFWYFWLEIINFRKWGKEAIREIPKSANVHISAQNRTDYAPPNLSYDQINFGEHIIRENDA